MKLEPYLSDEIIPDLNNIVRDIEDEGDRCYFGSTNDADRLREIADWLEANFRRTPPASQSDEALVVQTVETVTGEFFTEPGEPFYRIVIDGYCADFDHKEAAQNFADAISAREAAARRKGIEEAAKFLRDQDGYGEWQEAADQLRALSEKQHG